MSDTPDIHTVGESVTALSRDLGLLFVQTLQLARAELRTVTAVLRVSIIGIAVGVTLMLAGLLVLLSALVLIAIAFGLPAWAAALVVGTVLAGAGATAIWISAARLQNIPVTLPETRKDVEDTIAWWKEQTRA
jgi:hypothetical protein